MKNDDLIRRLCEASEGSAELSAEVWTALTGEPHFAHDDEDVGLVVMRRGENTYFSVPCLTTSLSAAWEGARKRAGFFDVDSDGMVQMEPLDKNAMLVTMIARTPALALCAALLAAEGEK